MLMLTYNWFRPKILCIKQRITTEDTILIYRIFQSMIQFGLRKSLKVFPFHQSCDLEKDENQAKRRKSKLPSIPRIVKRQSN